MALNLVSLGTKGVLGTGNDCVHRDVRWGRGGGKVGGFTMWEVAACIPPKMGFLSSPGIRWVDMPMCCHFVWVLAWEGVRCKLSSTCEG